MKHKAIGIQDKPEVDIDKLDELKEEEEIATEEKVEEIEEKLDEAEDDFLKGFKGKETPPPEPPKPEPPKIDYEIKFKESQKEALILKAQLDKVEEEKNKKVDITDDLLRGKYPDWDDLSVGEQKALRKSEELAQEVQELKNNANQFNNDRKWQEKVETFVTEEIPDLFPDIVGREEEFERFATRPTRKGLPMEDLAKVFLYENPPVDKKRSLFHAGGGAGTPPPADEGMNAEDVRTLRITKPLEYMRLVRAGKIKIKI
jgi:hypothetical protein